MFRVLTKIYYRIVTGMPDSGEGRHLIRKAVLSKTYFEESTTNSSWRMSREWYNVYCWRHCLYSSQNQWVCDKCSCHRDTNVSNEDDPQPGVYWQRNFKDPDENIPIVRRGGHAVFIAERFGNENAMRLVNGTEIHDKKPSKLNLPMCNVVKSKTIPSRSEDPVMARTTTEVLFMFKNMPNASDQNLSRVTRGLVETLLNRPVYVMIVNTLRMTIIVRKQNVVRTDGGGVNHCNHSRG